MEGVKHKVRWDVIRRVNKPIPHPGRPTTTWPTSWQAYHDIANELGEIIIPTCQQLREDAEWKK